MSPLDQQRECIQDDLRGLISGDVRCDDVFLQLFASDASIHEIKPLAVIRPSSTADVAACVRYALEKHLALHARGAGTGVAGESLGPGLVIDFSANLHRIIRIDQQRVRVQSGVVHERLNRQLRRMGRHFSPDPANSSVTTIGSMLAIDASGSRWLKYGSTRRYVQSLQIVLADGQVLEVGREPLADGVSTSSIPRKREIVNQLAAILRERAELIRQYHLNTSLNRRGYNLTGVLGDDYLDVARLLVGSEGTLALTTEALLNTECLPRHRGVALLFFDSLEKAARTVLDVLPAAPAACDLMDRRHLSLARELEPGFSNLIPAETEAALLVELDGEDPLELRARLHSLVKETWQQKRSAFGARQAFEEEEAEFFWRLVQKVQPALNRVKGPSRPVPIVEDITVPPDAIPDFLVRMQNVLKRNQVTAALFSHAGHGQIHVQPFLDLANPDDVQRLRRLAEELYEEVFSVGGSICGEHACGLSRTGFIRRHAGPLFDVFLEIKRIFDPQNVLNPGKIVGDDPDLITRYLRRPLPDCSPAAAATPTGPEPVHDAPSPGLRDLVELQLDWDPVRVQEAVAACNRCGECRTQASKLRMCPIFRFAPNEEAAPRAKANLIRAVLTGALDLNLLTSDEFKTIADLCVHCHACRLECPAGVDIPRLAREGKAAYVAAKGLPVAEWAMTRLDLLGALGGIIAPAANWALSNRQMRWLLEKTLGVSQGHKLPRVASRSFLRRAARRRLTRPSRRSAQKVLYFVDVYANYFDPQLAEATVAVLEHNGLAVYVHPDQRQAGMPSIACGALQHARRLAEHNVAILAESIRQGYHVVASEPAAALCLTHEYPQLLDDDDARLVAANSSEVCGFLWNMHTRGQLQLDFKPLNAILGYHMPCHMRALQLGSPEKKGTGSELRYEDTISGESPFPFSSPGEQLLGLIPGLRVRRVEAGCSGMAGTFGLLHQNYRNSLRIGWKLISRFRDGEFQAGVTECSACQLQMEQGAAKPAIHPIKFLALSYGLMPEIGLKAEC